MVSNAAGTATSGVQESTQVEQSNQSLAAIMENFSNGRTLVGEMLLSMVIEDMGSEPATVVIEGNAVKQGKQVMLNQPAVDEATGIKYLNNDVQRTRLKVAMEDVPTSSGFRAQQLSTLGEAVKSMPAAMQAAETVQTGVQSAFSAMQAAQVIATMPQVAPVADVVMQGAGYQRPNPAGEDPNFPQPQVAGVPAPNVQQNTSPEFPPIPQQAGTGMTGIETPQTADNFAQ